jgi:hypothetical protein
MQVKMDFPELGKGNSGAAKCPETACSSLHPGADNTRYINNLNFCREIPTKGGEGRCNNGAWERTPLRMHAVPAAERGGQRSD